MTGPGWLRDAFGGGPPGTEAVAWLELAARIDEIQAGRDAFDEAHRADRERGERLFEAGRGARAGRDGVRVAAGGRSLLFEPRGRIEVW